MQNHKDFRRIICVTILCALLMVSMGRATRVSAVGTTAAIAGTAFILTGAVYLSYVALTQGEMILPAADEMHNWLGSIGRKVSQYPSGSAAYQDIYQELLRDPTANLIDGVWTWTQDRIKSFTNDFTDTRIIDDIIAFEQAVDTSLVPRNGYNYGVISPLPTAFYLDNWGYVSSIAGLSYYGFSFSLSSGNKVLVQSNGLNYLAPSGNTQTVRNYKNTNGTYTLQYFDGLTWRFFDNFNYSVGTFTETYNQHQTGAYIAYDNSHDVPVYKQGGSTISGSISFAYPFFPDAVIYDSVTGETSDLIEVSDTEIVRPNWTDPDNDNRPIIPWVPIPQLPVNVTPPSGYVNPQWGFNLQDLLDKLEDLAGQMIDIGGIAALINEFAGLHGDNYYIEYNDGDTNYYTYYQPTIFDNDTEYVTYNIDISEQQDIVPVDLNTISLYTHNNYLDEVKDAARSFGSAIGEYVAFWHNCDPVLTYTILGSFVLILLGAFIGKWGHS